MVAAAYRMQYTCMRPLISTNHGDASRWPAMQLQGMPMQQMIELCRFTILVGNASTTLDIATYHAGQAAMHEWRSTHVQSVVTRGQRRVRALLHAA